MGRSHLITGACALEHVYVVNVLINKANIMPLTMLQQAVHSYLGIEELSVFTIPACLGAYFLGNLLPDIDNPNSILGRIVHVPVKHRTWLHAIYLYLVIGALRWLHPLFTLGFGKLEGLHPVFTACHPVFAIILAIVGWISPISAWLFFGTIVHLFWDSLSACGNCWFYKLFSDYHEYPNGAKIKKGHKLKLYHAGEWSEYLLLFIIIAVTVISFICVRRLS